MKAGILIVLLAGFVVAPSGAQTFYLGTNGLWIPPMQRRSNLVRK